MRGRRVLMESFVSHGVRHIFGNPGTTETPPLDSLPAPGGFSHLAFDRH
jgi:benzoylformate decarboxylase